MGDSTNENARPVDETGRAQELSQDVKPFGKGFGSDDAADLAKRKPSFDAATVRAFADAGLALFPLNGKKPVHSAWPRKHYDGIAEAAAAEGKHNLGVQLTAEVVVLDADPRNYVDGVNSLDKLAADLGIDLGAFPRVETGGGGVHVYMWKDPALQVPKNLDKAGYPGLDLKTKGGQVVAPGSIHPDTNKPYVGIDMDFLLAMQAPMPDALVALIRREKSETVSAQATEPGLWTPDELAQNLVNLDVDEFDSYHTWFQVMLSAHFATNGDGDALDVFTEWSTQYTGSNAASPDDIAKKWRGLTIGEGRITHKLICKLLHDRGHRVHDETPAELDFDQVEDQSTVDRRTEERWPFLTREQVRAMPPPKWLVDGFVQETTLVAIYGAPESGKSFLAIDFVMSIAAGLPWQGRDTTQGAVLYVAAEGALSLNSRFQAWEVEHGIQDVPLFLMCSNLNLSNPKEAAEFCTAMSKLGPLRMIVVDTLNQTSAGADENSAMEMGRYIDSMKKMRDASGAAVVVVHHSGKDTTKGMRGSTALLAGVDTTIEVVRPDKDLPALHIKVQKQKDAEKEKPIHFEMVKQAGSMVLRMTKGSVKETDAQFVSEELRLFDWIAAEMGSNETMPLGELLKRLEDSGVVSGKARTLRTKVTTLLGEGFDDAKRCSDGTRIWMERDKKNASTGPMVVHKIEVEK